MYTERIQVTVHPSVFQHMIHVCLNLPFSQDFLETKTKMCKRSLQNRNCFYTQLFMSILELFFSSTLFSGL